MAHLASAFSSYQTFLNGADAYWSVDLAAMNNSGVTGNVILATNTEDDGTRYLNVSVFAEGLTPDVQHAQHVHGLFDEAGNPADSRMPVISDDADKDGFVEVFEGLAAYGDIILPLINGAGALPMTDANGQLSFIQSYELGDDSNFFSPVTSTDYTADDLMPLETREIVIHGQNVGAGFGSGTGGEVDGTQDGYVGLLPVSSGEIEMTDLAQALDLLEDQFAGASDKFRLGGGDDMLDAGTGNDKVFGGRGNDRISGGEDDDKLIGGKDNDVLRGDGGDDKLNGSEGDDWLSGGAGDDVLRGAKGSDTVYGRSGDDVIKGNRGADTLVGGAGNDVIKGQNGNDFITGSGGADELYGGDGWDEFIYADMREGNDKIMDFQDGMDLLNMTGVGIGFDDLTIESANGGASTVVMYGNTNILLDGVEMSMIDSADFVF